MGSMYMYRFYGKHMHLDNVFRVRGFYIPSCNSSQVERATYHNLATIQTHLLPEILEHQTMRKGGMDREQPIKLDRQKFQNVKMCL